VIAAVLVSGFGFASAATFDRRTGTAECFTGAGRFRPGTFVAKGCIVCHHHAELSEVRRGFSNFRVGPDLPSVTTLRRSGSTGSLVKRSGGYQSRYQNA